MPDWSLGKEWSWVPFIPVLLTIFMQLLGLVAAESLIKRAHDELVARGISEEHQLQAALRIVQGFSLIVQLYVGLLPIVGSLLIIAISVGPSRSIEPVLIALFIAIIVITFAMIILMASPLEEIYWEWIAKATWSQRIMSRLKSKSYGTFFTYVSIVLTAVIQALTAFLLLPDAAGH